ncbi:MAG: hypothetical protein GY794_19745 [bacterium]|nr:hypothetical protein [bacterium]
MGWGTGRDLSRSALVLKFVPKGRSTKASIVAPNTSKKKTPSPPGFVTNVAKNLKLGDVVRIGYSTLYKRTWMTSLAKLNRPAKPGPNGQVSLDQFIFVSARKIRTSAGLRVSVVARKGSNRWSFLTPLEPVITASSGSQSDGTHESGPRALSDKIAKFTSGDIVALKYDTVNFRFILTDINPYIISAVGTLTRTDKRTIRGAQYKVAFVRLGKINKTLLVPQVNRLGGTTVSKLTSKLEALGDQKAEFAYYKMGGLMLVDGITPQ